MTALVRCFSFTGVTTAPVNAASGRYTSDSVSLMKNPYLARQSITASTGSAQNTSAELTPSHAKLLQVQIQPGKIVAIEVNPPNRSAEADVDSQYFSGDIMLECGPGWTLSIREIAVV